MVDTLKGNRIILSIDNAFKAPEQIPKRPDSTSEKIMSRNPTFTREAT
ncbi:hypothetical protein [Bacteroidetes bacterium endosymbiont of Geopemphigus sp.]|nr:hypothetical protein [Bacteroidetes bacterium endosymbiont of Geopemphigus sp.]